MRFAAQWVNLIQSDLRGDQTSAEQAEVLLRYVSEAQHEATIAERDQCTKETEALLGPLRREIESLRSHIDNVYEAANEAKTAAIQF